MILWIYLFLKWFSGNFGYFKNCSFFDWSKCVKEKFDLYSKKEIFLVIFSTFLKFSKKVLFVLKLDLALKFFIFKKLESSSSYVVVFDSNIKFLDFEIQS